MIGYTDGEIIERERELLSADFGMDDMSCWNSVAYLTCLTMFEIVQIIILGLFGQNLKSKTDNPGFVHSPLPCKDSRTVSEVTVIVIHK